MRAGWYSSGAALSILFLFPLLWGGYESFQGQAGSGQESGFGFGNYTRMAEYGEGIATYLLNTAAVSLMTVVGTLVVSALGGYAFARFRFPGKEILFLATLAILMVPYATILIPLYVVLGELGLQNSLVGLSLVMIMFQLPFAIFMMRNSFEAVPRELEEAALVDGCNSFSALRRILLRAVRPGLITVGLFAFLASWNDFFAPLDPDQRRLQVHAAGGGGGDARAVVRGDRLRRPGGGRDGDGGAVRDPLPRPATTLRAGLHVRSNPWLK